MHGGARRQLVAGHARGSAERPIQRGGGRHTCNSGGGERPKGAVALETVCPALFSYTGEVLISSLSLCLPTLSDAPRLAQSHAAWSCTTFVDGAQRLGNITT